MSVSSFQERMSRLSADVSAFQMEFDPEFEYQIPDLQSQRDHLACLQEQFRYLQSEVPGNNQFRRDFSQIREGLTEAEKRVDIARSKTISRYTGAPVTRNDSRRFEVLETTSQIIADEFRQNQGPLPQRSLDNIGIICSAAELELSNDPKFREVAKQLTDEWFDNAKQYLR